MSIPGYRAVEVVLTDGTVLDPDGNVVPSAGAPEA